MGVRSNKQKQIRHNFYSPACYKVNMRDRKRDPHGYLFADGRYKTTLLKTDLPPYYIELYIYGEPDNFLSAKGVKYLLYKPNYLTTHLHKDDILYISYDREIKEIPDRFMMGVEGYDHVLFGRDIARFVGAVRQYSGIDVSEIEREIIKKRSWFREHSLNGW